MSAQTYRFAEGTFVVLDADGLEELFLTLERVDNLVNAGSDQPCSAFVDQLQAISPRLWSALERGLLGASPSVAGRAIDSQWARGAYLVESDGRMLHDFYTLLLEHDEDLDENSPCRALGRYEIPEVTPALEDAAQAVQAAADNPQATEVTVDNGKVTATNAQGDVLSIANTAGSGMTSQQKVLLGLAVGSTIGLGIWLLVKGRK